MALPGHLVDLSGQIIMERGVQTGPQPAQEELAELKQARCLIMDNILPEMW